MAIITSKWKCENCGETQLVTQKYPPIGSAGCALPSSTIHPCTKCGGTRFSRDLPVPKIIYTPPGNSNYTGLLSGIYYVDGNPVTEEQFRKAVVEHALKRAEEIKGE